MQDYDIRQRFAAAEDGPEPAVRRIDVAAAVGQGRRKIRQRWAIGTSAATGAVAASVIAAVVFSGSPVTDGSRLPPPQAVSGEPKLTTAAMVLTSAANNADKHPAPRAHEGQFVYLRLHEWVSAGVGGDTKSATYMAENKHEDWRGLEDPHAVLMRITEVRREAVSPEDARILRELGIDLDRPAETEEFKDPKPTKVDPSRPFAFPTPTTLKSLPRDPDQLLAAVRKAAGTAGQSRDGEALVVIADLFRDADALIEPDLREALFKAAAKIPGITRQPGQATLDGKVGIAIGRVEPVDGVRQEIIIDPGSSRVIGERYVTVRPPVGSRVKPGTVTGWNSYESVLVRKVGDTTPAS